MATFIVAMDMITVTMNVVAAMQVNMKKVIAVVAAVVATNSDKNEY